MLIAQGVFACWFWTTLACMVALCCAVLAPTFFTRNFVVTAVLADPFRADHLADAIVYTLSFGAIFVIFGVSVLLSVYSPRTLNRVLRYLILLFNSIYPLNAVSSLFWLAIPPWLCFSGKFPFRLDAVAAIVGSLLLKSVEFLIVSKMKKDSEAQGSTLDEISIFRSQQMDKVTVPIKIRALMKGLQTGYKDVVGKRDNSFWESLGAGQAATSVQLWLLLVAGAMLAAIVAGIWKLVRVYIYGPNVLEVALPVGFGMVQSVITLWVIYDPLMFVLRGNAPRVSLRHIEMVIILILALITFSLLNSERTV